MNDAKPDVTRLPAKWRKENGDYPESKQDCANELEAALTPAGEGGLRMFSDAVERLAFKMPAPNEWTPQFVSLAIEARRLATTEQPGSSVQGEWTDDAESWGNALNEAAWTFTEHCPEKSALLFNNTKAPLRMAILRYAAAVSKATPPPAPAAKQGDGRLKALQRGLSLAREWASGTSTHVTDRIVRKMAEQLRVALSSQEGDYTTQPEARGVEGMVREFLTRAKVPGKDYLYCIKPKELDALFAAAPNPVRAEQQGLGAGGRYWRERAEFWRAQAVALGWREVRDAANGEQPEGKWKLVPVEATPKMMHAATVYQYGPGGPNYDHAGRWKAMLAAAPAAPGVRVDGEWLADVRRCLEDVSTEMRSRGRGDERFQRLIQRMPAALAPDGGEGE